MPGETATAPPGVPVPADRSVPRGRRLRLFLAVAAGMTALLCLGGVGVAVLLYDDATKIDRSAPDVVVSSYLRAHLVARDDKAADLLTCAEPDLAAMREFRSDIESREAQFSAHITVNWGRLAVQQSGGSATVNTEVVRSLDGGAERSITTWSIRVVDEDGWRVCSAAKVG
jgi:hypothetical protein